MFVAVGRVILRIPEARSLKDRRRVVKSYKDRVRARFGISVAEVGDVESHREARVALAAVSRESRQAGAVVRDAIRMAESLSGSLVMDATCRVLPFGNGGAELDEFASVLSGAPADDEWDEGEWNEGECDDDER